MQFQPPRPRLRPARPFLAALLGGCLVGSLGCGGLSSFRRDDAAALKDDPNHSIAGIEGPAQRALNATAWNHTREDLARDGDARTRQALADYDHAQALYDSGQYAAAEKSFAKLAKSRSDPHQSQWAKFKKTVGAADHDPNDVYSNHGDPIEEDSLFMVAQSQFQQRHYADAQNSYDELLNRYPSSRHLDETTAHLFRIAKYWLGFPDNYGSGDEKSGDIQLAAGESGAQNPLPKPRDPSVTERYPVVPNFTDNTRPLFDPYGRAEQALKSIWLHDATGPLADDALMMSANHHLRQNDFVEAARLYALVRDQYPDSPHVKDAFLLGSHVTLASYQGPEYDGKTLTDSRELRESMLQLFPELSLEQREELEKQVALLKEAEVERLWNTIEFYGIKGQDPSIELHCHLLINKYPDSQYADLARKTLIRLEEKRARRSNGWWPWGQNEQVAAQAAPAVSPPEKRSQPIPQPESRADAPDAAAAQKKWYQFPNPLRRAESPPHLQPAEAVPGPAGRAAPDVISEQ